MIDTAAVSNTASMADYWLSPWPGTEAAILLAMVHVHAARRHLETATSCGAG